MSHLQSEYRADKNGHVVLRHVRPEDSSNNSNRSIPAPTGMPALPEQQTYERNKEVHAHKSQINDLLIDFRLGFFQRRKLMQTLRPETLPMLVDNGVKSRTDENPGLPINLVKDCVRDKSFTLINDFAAYLNDVGMREDRPRLYSIAYLKGLRGGKAPNRMFDAYGFAPYSEATPKEKEAQRAVIRAAEQLGSQYIRREGPSGSMAVVTLKSSALVKYIKANPDKADAVVKLVQKRGIEPDETSLSAIEGLMSARDEISTPLIDGAL